ncbi:hypothetical protein D9M68_758690 [compost metagenome]
MAESISVFGGFSSSASRGTNQSDPLHRSSNISLVARIGLSRPQVQDTCIDLVSVGYENHVTGPPEWLPSILGSMRISLAPHSDADATAIAITLENFFEFSKKICCA